MINTCILRYTFIWHVTKLHTGMGDWVESRTSVLVEWIYPAEGSLVYVHVVDIGDVISKTNQSVTVVISHA